MITIIPDWSVTLPPTTPLYNAMVFWRHRENKSQNCMSLDGYQKDGELADGPPIINLFTFFSWLNRCKPTWTYVNIFNHADGGYLRSFTQEDLPNAETIENCTTCKRHHWLVTRFPPFNSKWKRLQTKSGMLKNLETAAPPKSDPRKLQLGPYKPNIKNQPLAHVSSPVRVVDNDGDVVYDEDDITRFARGSQSLRNLIGKNFSKP